MMLNSRPKQAYGLFIEDMDDESVLYRVGSHRAIHLNATAAVIWKLSDGTRTVQELADFLKAEYPEDQADILPDVIDAVELLSREGAVVFWAEDAKPSQAP